MRIAIIGAGPTGLVAARILQAAGEQVTLFDKGRGIGGRMATRRSAHGVFDHGAPGFVLRDAHWLAAAASWHRAGVCAPISIAGQDHWTGVGGMSAIGRWLGAKLDVRRSVAVSRVDPDGTVWDDQGELLGRFECVVVTAPAPQAITLAGEAAADCVSALQGVRYDACWTLMIALHTMPRAIATMRAPLAVVSREAEKPGRGASGECWVAYADARWSNAHIEDASDDVLQTLTDAFCASVGLARSAVAHAVVHRWRYAHVCQSLDSGGYVASQQAPIVFAGDYTLGDGVECAFRSAEAVATAVLSGTVAKAQGERAIPK